MENNSIDATNNRPHGERLIDTDALLIDIPSYTKQIKDENEWKEKDRNAITLFKSDKLRIILVALHRKAIMKTEKPENIMSIQVLKGKIDVVTNGVSHETEKEHIFAMHASIAYTIKALKKSIVLLTLAE